jgi:Bacteriophage probable baseplate hub protein
MKPQCRISINGTPVGGVVMDRLISCEVTDKEGSVSDSARVLLNNAPAAKIPQTGDEMQIWLGYGGQGMTFMGTFIIDEVELALFPHTMSITAKSADWGETVKENKERHWDETSVAGIVGDIAADHGLTARVDSETGAYVYSWFGQQDESDIHVLRRLERRHGALMSVKDNQLLFVKRGAGQTAGGVALSGFVVTPDNIVEGSGKLRFSERAAYKKVVGYHQDRDQVERVEIEAASDNEAEATYRIGEPFADPEEAQQAVTSKADELKRQAISFSCSVVGDPAARAGAPLIFSGMKVGVDGVEFIIDTARHSWSKSGYTAALSGNLKV